MRIQELQNEFEKGFHKIITEGTVDEQLEALDTLNQLTSQIAYTKREITNKLIKIAIDNSWYNAFTLNKSVFKRNCR